MQMPDWMTRLEHPRKPNYFVLDSDIFYPEWLAALKVENVDRLQIEIVLGCVKMEARFWAMFSGELVKGHPMEFHIRGDDGRKQRWNITMHPPGDVDFNTLSLKERGRLVREAFRSVKGFIPS
jgi:hypothetical protein